MIEQVIYYNLIIWNLKLLIFGFINKGYWLKIKKNNQDLFIFLSMASQLISKVYFYARTIIQKLNSFTQK